MFLSTNITDQIVDQLKDIINAEINFMDEKGRIISSTDLSRINQTHEGAIHVLNTGKRLCVSSKMKYSNTKEGINLPVNLNKKIIGVVGITGKINEIEKYSNLIQKMTEILVKEQNLHAIQMNKQEITQYAINKIINGELTDEDHYLFHESFIINNNVNRYLIVGKISFRNEDLVVDFTDFFESFFNHTDTLVSIMMDELIILTDGFFDTTSNKIEKTMQRLIDELSEKFNCKLALGISEPFSKLQNSNKYYKQAKIALATINDINTYKFYNNLSFSIIAHDLSENSKYSLIKKVFNSVPTAEITKFIEIIETLGVHSGSIKKASNELFIHKNTLQYQINKFKSYTGYDVRVLNDYALVKIVLEIINFDRPLFEKYLMEKK